jgi:SMODS and SLOG-associating 2TM effector domain 2
VATAGALVLIDSSLTLSSSWTRYVLSAQKIDRLIEEFQFDWEMLRAAWGQRGPDSRQIADALELLKQTASDILQVLEHEVAVGAVELRADIRSALEVKPDAPGTAGANVILTNREDVQDDWLLEVDGRPYGRHTGGRAAVAGLQPGAHEFRVEGAISGQLRRDMVCARVSLGEIVNVELTLRNSGSTDTGHGLMISATPVLPELDASA